MADTKLTGLTAITSLSTDDLLYVVDDPLGTPASKKITWANVLVSIKTALGIYIDGTANNFGAGENALNAIIAGSTENTAVGDGALKLMQDSDANTACGYNALGGLVSTGGGSGWNTAVGYSAMSGTMTVAATKNTSVGGNTMLSITSGTLNTTIGYHSTEKITTGNNNSACGVDCLNNETTGSSNAGLGYAALSFSTGASSNVAVGANACRGLSVSDVFTGSFNVFVGYRAGYWSKETTTSVFIGQETGYGTYVRNISNSILLGNGASTHANNTVSIGNSSVTNMGLFGNSMPTLSLGFRGSAARTFGVERNPSSASNGVNLTVQAGGASQDGALGATPTVTAGGTGYIVGEILTITTGDGTAKCVVETVAGTAVATVLRVTNGSGYSTGAGQATTSDRAGTGCTLNIGTVQTASNKTGGNLILSSGISTGTGTSAIQFNTAPAGASGSADNAVTTKMQINGAGQVSIGTTSPNAAALLQADSTSQGFLPPRMTTAQKNAITTPPSGLVVYDSTLGKLCVFGAAAWETITSV